MQQQFGLPVNGVWGHLERQLFDNARVRTAPSSSAQALMPPDYNRTRANGSNRRQYRSVQGGNDYAAQPVPKSLRASGVPFSGDWTGVLGWAGAGLFTAAVVVKADAKRRGREVRIYKEGGTETGLKNLWGKLTGKNSNEGAPAPAADQPLAYDSPDPGFYDSQGYFHQEPPAVPTRPRSVDVPDARAEQQLKKGGYYDDSGRWWDITATKDSFDPFPGGYPVPRDEADSFAASAPVRPGDRRRAQMAKEPQYPPAHYHPAFAPGGSAFNPDAPDVGTVPPRVPPPRGTPPPVRGNSAEWVTPGYHQQPGQGAGSSTGGIDRNAVISLDDVRDAKDYPNPGPLSGPPPKRQQQARRSIGGPARGGGGGGGGGGSSSSLGGGGRVAPPAGGGVPPGMDARPTSRSTNTVPPFGDWGAGGAPGGDIAAYARNNVVGGGTVAAAGRRASGPAAVPEFGGADSVRGLTPGGGFTDLGGPGGLGAGTQPQQGPMAMVRGANGAVATLQTPQKVQVQSKGVLGVVGDGLRFITGVAPAFGPEQKTSEFTARAQRERELLAQVNEAQEFARMEQKKRQQLEAAYQSTRNALREAEKARTAIKDTSVADQMKGQIQSLEKALNARDVTGAVGQVFTPDAPTGTGTGTGTATPTGTADQKALNDRMAALETALASAAASAGSDVGSVAALAAMNHLQEKVKGLEQAFNATNQTSAGTTAAMQKIDAILKQVQDEAKAVPELRQQMVNLRAALQQNPAGALAAGGSKAVEENLKTMSDRLAKLEAILANKEANPLSLDVLYAKVGAIEEGLASAANGSATMLRNLEERMQKLEGGKPLGGVATPVQAPGVNNVLPAFKPPTPPPAAPSAPAKKPPSFTPAKPAAPKKDAPAFTPAFEIKGDSVAPPAPAQPPGLGLNAKPAAPEVDPALGDDYKIEEGTLPRIATGREVMLQGFNWESHRFEWYKLVQERAGQISKAGFTQIWLPPCTDSLAPEGYLPRNLRSLETKYGNEAELRSLIGELRANNVLPVLDAVLNHRCATHQGKHGKWNRWEGTGMDWGEWAITNRNKDFMGEGGEPTGDEFWGSPNIDHKHPKVQEDICEWIQWLTNDVGFGGIRFDFSKGYGGEFAGNYTRACMPEFAVGEYWDTLNYGQGLEYDQDAHRQRIIDWIDSTGGICTAFDFTTKGILQEACGRSEFWRLVDKKGRAPGVIGLWPGRAVTFIDNHDTGSTQSHWPFPSNKVGMGYAYTLTHPGTPSVFWDHYFDWGDDLRNQIQGLMDTRKKAGIHARSKLEIVAATDSVYAALVGDKLAMKMGNDGWKPSGDGWNVAVSGDGWCVWTKD